MTLPLWFAPFTSQLRACVEGADPFTVQAVGGNTDTYLRTIRKNAVQSEEVDTAIDAVREEVAGLIATIRQNPYEHATGGSEVSAAREQALEQIDALIVLLEHVEPSDSARALYD